jgi:hypothetical protein
VVDKFPVIDAKNPKPGWHWWDGRGNDRHIDGYQATHDRLWVVYVWMAETPEREIVWMADSALWKKPMKVEEMGGQWLGAVAQPVRPPKPPV